MAQELRQAITERFMSLFTEIANGLVPVLQSEHRDAARELAINAGTASQHLLHQFLDNEEQSEDCVCGFCTGSDPNLLPGVMAGFVTVALTTALDHITPNKPYPTIPPGVVDMMRN